VSRRPPPPPGSERRKHPRFELLAQIELRAGGEIELVDLADISAGGGFIQLDRGSDLVLEPGQTIRVALSVGDDGELGFETDAEVVRRVPPSSGRGAGYGLMWTSHDGAVAHAIAAVLSWVDSKGKPR
jgi:hypothetical protein